MEIENFDKTSNQQPATCNQQPATSNQQPPTSNLQPATRNPQPPTFNLRPADCPLEGTNLIEASAGTGKTYTITALFLRLILEKGLTVNEILVVTFTEAATEELKDRIRSRLREVLEVFSGKSSEDTFLNMLAQRNHEQGRKRIEEAIRDFDEAAIFTIHSFCKRMLHENAFESGSLFDSELVADQESLKQEIVEDFWRRHFYNASRAFVNYALSKEVKPDTLLSLLHNSLSHPNLKIVPDTGILSKSELGAEDLEAEFKAAFDAVSNAWTSEKETIKTILRTDNALKRNIYPTDSIPNWIESMEAYLISGNNNPVFFKEFEKFTTAKIANGTKKNCIAPKHPFFDLCQNLKEKQEQLAASFDKRLMKLKADLFQYVREEFQKRKENQNILSFDDLLFNLQTAIHKKESGELLVKNIRDRFKAALIDEFQDTDPIQYDIFRTVFSDTDAILFLIGDPKQAIYKFRGADIFAYIGAASDATSLYTLGENWRSEPDLITAVNTVFENADPAFVYDEIPFRSVQAAAEKKNPVFLKIRGESHPPLQLWFIRTEEEKKNIPKYRAEQDISGAVAGEISRLLAKENEVLLGEEPIKAGDIAVLVRKNTEAKLIQRALLAYKIPAVLHSTGNIFDSHEALEMERVLSGIAQPGNERLLKAALATDIMGIKGEHLDHLAADEAEWETWLTKFRDYHDIWRTSGFIRMFRQFIAGEGILIRLMSLPDGERRNTNVLHLAELLHQASVEKKLGMAWLIKWLAEQRNPNTPRLEENQLRLESDENAVKIVTIHKSKGLEYPLVFCPFMYGNAKMDRKNYFLFHNENDNRKLTLDIGSEDIATHKRFAQQEELAENLRLLYVALTRAKNRCYLVWGRFNEAGSSAPAYLFHHPGPAEDIVSAATENFKNLSDSDIFQALEAVRDKSLGTVGLSEMPDEPGHPYSPPPDEAENLTFREFSQKTDHKFRISSFSALTSGRSHRAETGDYDPQTVHYKPPEPEDPAQLREEVQDIFSFPKGSRAGKCLHKIFEHLDFTNKNVSDTEELIAKTLGEYDFDLTWKPAICDMIRKTLSVNLDGKELTLSRIRNEDRLNELEFYFPLNEISPPILKDIFAEYAGPEFSENFPESIERLKFSPVRGFMKGFIDTVFQFREKFYLVDWKSNFLGFSTADYHQGALANAMNENFYILQYHIYTMALHQYLSLRIRDYSYESHFGGVYYIFLRGTDPDRPEFGIYRDKPREMLITKLCEKINSSVFRA